MPGDAYPTRPVAAFASVARSLLAIEAVRDDPRFSTPMVTHNLDMVLCRSDADALLANWARARPRFAAYEARYHAVYAGFLTFEYTTTLYTLTGADGQVNFKGAEDLGYAKEGVYHYEGHTDGNEFFSTYKANFDHGTYTMERPLD